MLQDIYNSYCARHNVNRVSWERRKEVTKSEKIRHGFFGRVNEY